MQQELRKRSTYLTRLCWWHHISRLLAARWHLPSISVSVQSTMWSCYHYPIKLITNLWKRTVDRFSLIPSVFLRQNNLLAYRFSLLKLPAGFFFSDIVLLFLTLQQARYLKDLHYSSSLYDEAVLVLEAISKGGTFTYCECRQPSNNCSDWGCDALADLFHYKLDPHLKSCLYNHKSMDEQSYPSYMASLLVTGASHKRH